VKIQEEPRGAHVVIRIIGTLALGENTRMLQERFEAVATEKSAAQKKVDAIKADIEANKDADSAWKSRRRKDLKAAEEALAKEQFLYCSDIVEQGAGSIRNLASILLNGRAWYFWWD